MYTHTNKQLIFYRISTVIMLRFILRLSHCMSPWQASPRGKTHDCTVCVGVTLCTHKRKYKRTSKKGAYVTWCDYLSIGFWWGEKNRIKWQQFFNLTYWVTHFLPSHCFFPSTFFYFLPILISWFSFVSFCFTSLISLLISKRNYWFAICRIFSFTYCCGIFLHSIYSLYWLRWRIYQLNLKWFF